jgi:uncharacterized protein YfdQ (DUF2303 family)
MSEFDNAPDAAVTADVARRAAEAAASPIDITDHPEGLVVRRLRQDERIGHHDFGALLPSPREARGEAELHTARSFAAYVNRLADLGTTVWADQGRTRITAVFNDHTRTLVDSGIGEELPGWRDHRAVFLPQYDEEWLAWQKVDASQGGRLMTKKAFGQFLADHAHSIRGTDVSRMIDAAMQLVASRVKTTQEDVDLDSGQVNITYTEEVRGQKVPRAAKLPPRFKVALHVYQGAEPDEEPFEVEAVTQWDVDTEGRVGVGIRLQQVPLVKQAAWQREIARLLGLFRPEVLTLAGAAPDALR